MVDVGKLKKVALKNYRNTVKKFKTEYYNFPVSFDIETTSFYDVLGEKTAIMYIWQFAINDVIFYGRNWDEFLEFLFFLQKYFQLNNNRRMIIYVHNLGYEFQFMRKYLKWDKVFSLDKRKPIYAICYGFEFRCSYLLSGYSLSYIGNTLQKHDIKKLTGDLDYNLIRHEKTPLTEKELQYCFNDVLVVNAYIDELLETNDNNITHLPLTKTGFVRKYCRKNTMGKSEKYSNFIKELTIEKDEFKMLQRAFCGGFTHANVAYSNQIVEDVTSYDFTSSYPTVMLSELFPMSKGKKVKVEKQDDFEKYIKYYCCIFDICIVNLRPKIKADNPLSVSRCKIEGNKTTNNGRIITADKVYTTTTNVDFQILRAFYTWDYFTLGTFYIYVKKLLPKEFILSILKLYEDKTKLKGVDGKEKEYLSSKEMLNSCYGMCVTSPVRDNVIYDDNLDLWDYEEKTLDIGLNEYNNDKNRFLFYPWGVFVTAYARYNLFTGIKEFNNDYVYSDTDSIKVINVEQHRDYIIKYNEAIKRKLKFTALQYGIDEKRFSPMTIKGIEKPLGVWDFDGHYKLFKTLGAKRYMYLDDNDKLSLTVSGLNKKIAIPYLLEKYKGKNYNETVINVFNAFTDGLYIESGYTGKQTHTYIDDRKHGFIVDYKGNKYEYDCLSGIHLENGDYSLSLTLDYLRLILQEIQKDEKTEKRKS